MEQRHSPTLPLSGVDGASMSAVGEYITGHALLHRRGSELLG